MVEGLTSPSSIAIIRAITRIQILSLWPHPMYVSLVTELPSQAVCVIDFLFYSVSLYHSGPHYNLRSILHHFTFAQFAIIIQAAITFGQLWAVFGFDEIFVHCQAPPFKHPSWIYFIFHNSYLIGFVCHADLLTYFATFLI